jgi:hypothetical protein
MHKRGDLHPDGSGRRLLGYQYRKTKNGKSEKREWWVTPYRYESEIERIRIKNLNWRNNNREHYREYKRKWVRKNIDKEVKRVSEWTKKNPEKVKARSNRAYQRNPARFKESAYKWKNKNLDKYNENRRRWRAARKDIENERTQKWRSANPEKTKESARRSYRENADLRARHKAYAARRKASLKDAFFKLNNEEQKKLLRMYKMAEIITEHTGITHHIDHWQPLSRGGRHHPDNLVIVKAEENLKKRAIPVDNLPPNFFSNINLPEGFFEMDWVWRGGRKPRAKRSQSATNPQ